MFLKINIVESVLNICVVSTNNSKKIFFVSSVLENVE